MKNVMLFEMPQEQLDEMSCMLCGGTPEGLHGTEYIMHFSDGPTTSPRKYIVYSLCKRCLEEVQQSKESMKKVVKNIEKELEPHSPQIPTPPSKN